ncbi:sulfotransferase family protein [Pseudomonas sp. 30_B]|uniref:sulfotransferase family protein n=1 Tax=Pseudomonas sp. 30_B TaxID=2813575 RepID=UPI001FAF584E|nr:sulfotransferase family protein [Pseudomonas sp. 30_B]
MESMMVEDNFHGWLPIRAWRRDGEWRLDWCWFGEQRLTRPFFRDDVDLALRLPFNQVFRRETSLNVLLERQAASPGVAPGAFIYHASRCGSTLLAQMLAGLGRHIVLSEPPALDSLLRAHLLDPAATDRQPQWIRALLSAYGQRRQGGEERLFVKLDAWNVFEAPLLHRLYPDTPGIFLYRDPLEIVISQLRQPGMHRVPGLLGPSGLDCAGLDAQAMAPLEFTCRMIGRIIEQGLALCQEQGCVPVNYSELPGALWGRLAPLFGLVDADVPKLRDIAAFDAKQPAMWFSADSQRKRDEAGDEVRAAVDRWARAPYEKLEQVRCLKQTLHTNF